MMLFSLFINIVHHHHNIILCAIVLFIYVVVYEIPLHIIFNTSAGALS